MSALLLGALLAGVAQPLTLEPFSGLGPRGLEVGCMRMTSGATVSGGAGFGGYSGIDLDRDDGKLTLLSDRAHLVIADIALGPDGAIRGIGSAMQYEIDRPRGARGRSDTEGLARYGGDWLVSREKDHDAIRVSLAGGTARELGQLVDLAPLGPFESNGSLEAVADIGGGRYLFIPESGDARNLRPILLWFGAAPRRVAFYQGTDKFDVTDMTADPDNDRLFVLERAFSRRLGPRARLTVLPLSEVLEAAPGDVLLPEELGRLTFFEGADNMEGIDAFVAEDGSRNLVLVSDDNFNDIQRTVLMTLRLEDGCALPTAKP